MTSHVEDELQEDERTKFRSITMQLYPFNAASEGGSEKDAGAYDWAWKRLKRIGRYLVGRLRCVQRFPLQLEFWSLTVKVTVTLQVAKRPV